MLRHATSTAPHTPTPVVPDAPPALHPRARGGGDGARAGTRPAPSAPARQPLKFRAPPTPHGADVEAIVDRLCVQPHLAEAVLSKLVGILQPQR